MSSRVTKTAQELQFPLSPSDHEDICSDVFAVLLENECRALRNFRGSARVSTWLTAITRRVSIRRLLKLARAAGPPRFPGENESPPIEPATSDSSQALEQLIRREEHSRVHAAMRHLKESDRHILTMFYLQNLKYTEISSRLGISTNTVGPKLQRAQHRLRRLLQSSPRPPKTDRFR